jgi:hypothetical protein
MRENELSKAQRVFDEKIAELEVDLKKADIHVKRIVNGVLIIEQ